jgi:hypothetical protein
MKHARDDYNRIQDPAGLIPDDEPVFLLRGQDRHAAEAVEHYASLVAAAGGDMEIVARAHMQAARMRAWPTHKDPDI